MLLVVYLSNFRYNLCHPFYGGIQPMKKFILMISLALIINCAVPADASSLLCTFSLGGILAASAL